jgi:hypothetical protein
MAQTALIPAWVAPAARAVADCHWIAHACAVEAGPQSRYAQVLAVMDWVTTDDPTHDQAVDMMMASDGAAYDTVVWLLGRRPAPVQLPRRNPDGTLMTVEQLTAEYMTGKWDCPEERNAAEQHARTEAARSRRLAALVPH